MKIVAKSVIKMFMSLLIVFPFSVSGQVIDLPFTGSESKWEITSFNFKEGKYEAKGKVDLDIENFMGKESVHLMAGTVLHTKDIGFTDGAIEVDVYFPDVRNFPGIAFRMQDFDNFELFYLGAQKANRPDATRYTPVFNGHGQQAWQLYYGKGYTVPFPWKFNTWHHIKIDVKGLKADIYIDDMTRPLYRIPELRHGWKPGEIALIADEAPIHFANARYTPGSSTPPPPIAIPPSGTNGVVTRWQVSNVTTKDPFEKENLISSTLKKQLTWTTTDSDSSGILNLYRFAALTRTNNTMVAKVMIESSAEQVKGVTFGFSDEVRVYLNDRILYRGSDIYGSRDYQFIGTIGFFDTVYLPLKKGKNELWFVVSEIFGGWGVQAKFEDMAGVSLK